MENQRHAGSSNVSANNCYQTHMDFWLSYQEKIRHLSIVNPVGRSYLNRATPSIQGPAVSQSQQQPFANITNTFTSPTTQRINSDMAAEQPTRGGYVFGNLADYSASVVTDVSVLPLQEDLSIRQLDMHKRLVELASMRANVQSQLRQLEDKKVQLTELKLHRQGQLIAQLNVGLQVRCGACRCSVGCTFAAVYIGLHYVGGLPRLLLPGNPVWPKVLKFGLAG
jgi:hypothetical protein